MANRSTKANRWTGEPVNRQTDEPGPQPTSTSGQLKVFAQLFCGDDNSHSKFCPQRSFHIEKMGLGITPNLRSVAEDVEICSMLDGAVPQENMFWL